MYSRKNEENDPIQSTLNVNSALLYWLDKGAPPSKLVLGLGLYGRAFTLENEQNTLPGSNATGAAKSGKYTREDGFLSYYEVCQNIKKKNWKVEWDNEALVPYAYKGKEWVGYDDEKSIQIKVLYAKEIDLAGIMFWVNKIFQK